MTEQPPPDLFEQVFHAIEGEEIEQRVSILADGSQKTVEFRYFGPDKWIRRVHKRGIVTPLQFLAFVHFVLHDLFDPDQNERRIVEGWYRAMLDAAEKRVIVPRDRDSLLPLDSIDGWNNWVLSVADADAFVASVGMEWTCTEVAAHLFNESYPGEVSIDDLLNASREKQEAEPTETASPASDGNSNSSERPLTPEQKAEIIERAKNGETHTALGKEYGKTRQAISKIVASAPNTRDANNPFGRVL